MRGRQADGVVMHKIDRSARNFADWAKIGDLADAGIDVHFASESLDFRSRGGRLSADIQAVIAADYIRNLREETLKGMYGRLEQGLYPWAAPIGYCDNGGGKVKTPDPLTAPLIRELFDLYASGQYPIRALRAEMQRRGLRNASGKPLSKTGIETVLSNPFYCGIIRVKQQGATYRGVHAPIVPVSLFNRVQALKLGRTQKKTTRHSHLYRGLFRCAHCGAAMTPERQKGHVYYRCQTATCMTKTIREEELELAIRESLSLTQLTEGQVAEATRCVAAWSTDGNLAEVEKVLELQRGQIDARLDGLTDALIDRLIDKEAYGVRRERLMLEKVQVEERLAAAQTRPDSAADPHRFLELIKSLAALYLFLEPAEKRMIVEIAVSNRRVYGKSLGLEPASWLQQAETAIAGLCGAHHRATSRTSQKDAPEACRGTH